MSDTRAIEALTRRFNEELKGYKEFAEKRRNRRKWTQEKVLTLYEALCRYIAEQGKKPLTVAGAMIATGCDRGAWYRMRDGEYDYLMEEFCDLHGVDPDECPADENDMPYCMVEGQKVLLVPYSDIIKKYMLILQERLEQNLYSGRGNPVGSIFALKALHGWQDNGDGRTTNNTLVLNHIATREEAEEALRLLRD